MRCGLPHRHRPGIGTGIAPALHRAREGGASAWPLAGLPP
jgi:hypothetical protein